MLRQVGNAIRRFLSPGTKRVHDDDDERPGGASSNTGGESKENISQDPPPKRKRHRKKRRATQQSASSTAKQPTCSSQSQRSGAKKHASYSRIDSAVTKQPISSSHSTVAKNPGSSSHSAVTKKTVPSSRSDSTVTKQPASSSRSASAKQRAPSSRSDRIASTNQRSPSSQCYRITNTEQRALSSQSDRITSAKQSAPSSRSGRITGTKQRAPSSRTDRSAIAKRRAPLSNSGKQSAPSIRSVLTTSRHSVAAATSTQQLQEFLGGDAAMSKLDPSMDVSSAALLKLLSSHNQGSHEAGGKDFRMLQTMVLRASIGLNPIELLRQNYGPVLSDSKLNKKGSLFRHQPTNQAFAPPGRRRKMPQVANSPTTPTKSSSPAEAVWIDPKFLPIATTSKVPKTNISSARACASSGVKATQKNSSRVKFITVHAELEFDLNEDVTLLRNGCHTFRPLHPAKQMLGEFDLVGETYNRKDGRTETPPPLPALPQGLKNTSSDTNATIHTAANKSQYILGWLLRLLF